MLNLARATGTELATSAEICANTLSSFELPASEMVRVSDVMVAAANNSAQTLEDLGESMSYCAPIASEYGLSLEQTAKATEKSEKHLEKIAAKDEPSGKEVVAKKDATKDSASGEDPTVRELKLQTRYLRDLSDKGIDGTFG